VKMKRILLVSLGLLAIILLTTTISKSQTPEGFYEYEDPYWKFSIDVPIGWKVNNDPNEGVGFVISSSDLAYDPIGNPETGIYIQVNVFESLLGNWDEYISSEFRWSEITLTKTSDEDNENSIYIYGYNESRYPFYDKLIYLNGYIYHFHSSTNISNQDHLVSRISPVYDSISLIGTPTIIKTEAPLRSEARFSFSPLKWPFEHGYGKILSGYNVGLHTGGDQYAFDICQGLGCSKSELGDYVLAPTDMLYISSWDFDGNGTLDGHFFEIADDGTKKLCLSMAHYELDQILIKRDPVPAGLALGRISKYAVNDIDHIHMGLFTVPNSQDCDVKLNRIGLEYNGDYKLDGISYPEGPNYQNVTVESHNQGIYMCLIPNLGRKIESEIEQDAIQDISCFEDQDFTPPTGYITSPSNGATITSGTVTISANANDNSGGSGINKVEFRANWPGSTYSIIGTDYTSPYSISWNMCNSNVPDGIIELDIKVFDNAGNYYIYSEHYSKPKITKAYTCSGVGGNCPTDGRDGAYLFADQNYAGDCYYSTANIPNLGTTTVGNDRLSSVKIIGDYQLHIYEDVDYGGRYDELNNSDANLDIRSLGGQYSSVKIEQNISTCPSDNRSGVYMYSDPDYLGDCLFSTVNIPFFGDTIIGDNDLSSIRFVGTWDAKLYKYANYEGTYEFVGSNESNLNDWSLGGQFSSAKLIYNIPAPTPTVAPNTFILLSPSINNGGFESASLTGWTQSGGTFVIDGIHPHSGSWYVKGTSAAEAKIYRYFDLTSYRDAINAGRVSSTWKVYIDVGDSEEYKYIVRFMDSANNILYSHNTGWSWHDGEYDDRNGHLDILPANSVKAYVEMSVRRSSGDFTDCDLDDFYLDIHIEPEILPTPTPTQTPTPIPDCMNSYPSSIMLYDYAFCSTSSGILPINVTKTLFNLPDISWDSKISSLMIPDGWSLVAYDGNNGTGDWVCLGGSNNDLSQIQFANGTSLNNTVSSVIAYSERDCPQIEASNYSFITTPLVGEEVSAGFKIKNISGRTLSFEGVLVGVHGPFCTQWDCPNLSDFPWANNIILNHGETYTYNETRAFNIANDQYLMEYLTKDSNGIWKSYQPSTPFVVSRGIEITNPVVLTPNNPTVGQQTNAQFTIKNFGTRTITLPNLMVIAKGPNCTTWDCPEGWADYPWVQSISLAPGAEYTYSRTRSFDKAGVGYFADAAFGDSNVWWYQIPNDVRYHFQVFDQYRIFFPIIRK